MDYKTIDLIKASIPDCLVKYNKIGRGSGEARLYVGGRQTRNWEEFFCEFKLKCFFDKQGLLDYLYSIEFEYKNPSQGYKRDIKGYWQMLLEEINKFPEFIYFNISPNNDKSNRKNENRFFIKGNDPYKGIWDFFRRISIPNMSSVQIRKILVNDEVQLWFRLHLNNVGSEFDRETADELEAQIESDNTIAETEKETIIKARKGQGNYRDLIIEKYKSCIITGIDDNRVLIASHIKPWVYSNNKERISQQNGLLLSPTFDKLFDKGFISFKDSGVIMLSNHFSDDNFERVGCNGLKGTKFNIRITNEMKLFLDFHRDTIFMD